jgi:hypothetical protein
MTAGHEGDAMIASPWGPASGGGRRRPPINHNDHRLRSGVRWSKSDEINPSSEESYFGRIYRGGGENQIFFRVVIIGPMKKLNSQSPGCKAKAVTAILLLKTNQLCVSIKLRP